MAETTVVHLLRHGEVHNPDNVLYGRLPDYHLSDNGRQMAETVAKTVAGRDVTAIFSSPLERARETAVPLAEAFRLDVTIDERLIEAENIFEGLSLGRGDGLFRNPRFYRYLWNPLRPSWGERYTHLVRRMSAAIVAARRAARGHEAIMVSHQLPIWTIRLAAEGRRLPHDPRRRQCGLASLTTFSFEGDRLISVGYSEPAAALVKRPTVPGA
ncbi:histidine phosphatase family protein [Streptosporangium sp. NPDC023615]|uniref:histidine phosphatase family protein n=1 Tax=Streptosporangium sp. NPDC023615 TaxID=3154794 RepID=UPI003416F2FA